MLTLILATAPTEERDYIVTLYKTYATYMYRIADRILKNKSIASHDAEDAVQDAFVWICKHSGSIPKGKDAKTKAYLAVVAKNSALQICRKEKVQPTYLANDIDDPEDLNYDIPSVKDFSEELVGRLEPERALILVKQLDEKYRDPIFLHYVVNMSVKDIANLQGVPVNTVRTQIYRGIKKIRVQLGIVKGDDRRDRNEE